MPTFTALFRFFFFTIKKFPHDNANRKRNHRTAKRSNKIFIFLFRIGISYQQNTFKPSDAKIRRIQTPTQISNSHIITQGNQSKMRPDSHGECVFMCIFAAHCQTNFIDSTRFSVLYILN